MCIRDSCASITTGILCCTYPVDCESTACRRVVPHTARVHRTRRRCLPVLSLYARCSRGTQLCNYVQPHRLLGRSAAVVKRKNVSKAPHSETVGSFGSEPLWE